MEENVVVLGLTLVNYTMRDHFVVKIYLRQTEKSLSHHMKNLFAWPHIFIIDLEITLIKIICFYSINNKMKEKIAWKPRAISMIYTKLPTVVKISTLRSEILGKCRLMIKTSMEVEDPVRNLKCGLPLVYLATTSGGRNGNSCY